MRSVPGTIVLAVVLASCGPGDGSPATSGGVPTTIDARTIEEAIRSDAAGPVLVAGYLFARNGTVTLCDGILESYPPQCGQPSIRVGGLDVEQLSGLRREGELSWTADRVSLEGQLVDGILEVTQPS